MAWIDKLVAARSSPKHVDFDALPLRLVVLDGRVVGILILLFANVWGGVPAVMMLLAALGGGESFPLVMLLFPLFGLGLFYVGLELAFRRRVITLERDRVVGEERRLGGDSRWAVDRDDYGGVLLEATVIRRGKTSVNAWRVQLDRLARGGIAPQASRGLG